MYKRQPREKGFYPLPGLATDLDGHITLVENGISYDVDYINGQKTGFFLDQKYNRREMCIRDSFRSRRSPITHRAATEAVVVMVRRVCRIWSMGTSFQGMGQWGVLSNWTRKDRGPAGCPGVV